MKLKRLSLVMMSGIFLVACSTEQSSQDYNMQNYANDAALTDSELFTGSQIIQQVDLSFETAPYDDAIRHVEETLKAVNGTVEYANENRNQRRSGYGPELQAYRHKDYTLRIPTDSLDLFLDKIDDMEATKLWERLGSQDVSEQYTDLEARLSLAKQKEERLTGFLDEAATMEEVLLIEEQLSIAIENREMIESEMKSIDSVVERTVVQLSIEELGRISNQPQGRPGFWDRASQAIVDSFYSFYFWLQDALIWFIFVLPYLLVGLLFFQLFLFIRSTYRKSSFATNRAKRQEEWRRNRKEQVGNRRRRKVPSEATKKNDDQVPPQSSDES